MISTVGWVVAALLIILTVLGGIGIVYLSTTPCYHGALKASNSHLMSLAMASGCSTAPPPPAGKIMKLHTPGSKPPPTPPAPPTPPTPTQTRGTVWAWLWAVIVGPIVAVLIAGGAGFVRMKAYIGDEYADTVLYLSRLGATLAMAGNEFTDNADAAEDITYAGITNDPDLNSWKETAADPAAARAGTYNMMGQGLIDKPAAAEKLQQMAEAASNTGVGQSLWDYAAGVVNGVVQAGATVTQKVDDYYDDPDYYEE